MTEPGFDKDMITAVLGIVAAVLLIAAGCWQIFYANNIAFGVILLIAALAICMPIWWMATKKIWGLR